MGWQHSLKLRGKSTLDPPKQRINSQYNLNTTQIIALSQKSRTQIAYGVQFDLHDILGQIKLTPVE